MIKEVLVSYSKDNKALISTYLLVVIVGIIASFVLIPKFTSDLMNSISAKNKNNFNVNQDYIIHRCFKLGIQRHSSFLFHWSLWASATAATKGL